MYKSVISSIIKNKFNIKQYPSFVTFIITWMCNGRCVFCDVWKKRRDYQNELNTKEIIDIFKQLRTLDVLRLTGGEPFLRSDLSEVINSIEKINSPSVVHLTSNGILTERIINQLKDVKNLDKVHIKISIDNVGEKHDKMRGVPGAYEKAMTTVEKLVKLSEKTKMHVGVNQVIVEESEIDSYFKLKKELDFYKVPIYPIVAYKVNNSLYSNEEIVDPKSSIETITPFKKESLEKFINILIQNNKENNDFIERAIDNYRLKGLYNRLIKKINYPKPKCVALNNHMRLLPNGDVPVCLYNGKIVGNLKREKFKNLWFGKKIDKQRAWVKNCSGCWTGCESKVSATYTGDIWRGLFY